MSTMRTCSATMAAAVAVLAAGAGAAWADSPVGMCVPAAGGAAITTPTSGTTCAAGSTYTQTARQSDLAAAEAKVAALQALLTGVTRSAIDGHTTLRFSGENVQVVNGSGKEDASNGLGNVVVGYNETPGDQTGSHNLILGRGQTAT